MASARSVICNGHSRPIPQIQFKDTEDGLFLISACLDNRPMLRDGPSGDWIGSFVGHNGAVWCAHLNSNATRAVTASADFTAKYWCALTGKMLHSFDHRHIVRATAFSKDDTKVFTAGHEGKIRLFDLKKPDADPFICEDKGRKIQHLLRSEADENVIISTNDSIKALKIWDLRTMTIVRSINTEDLVTDLTTCLDGSLICAAVGKSCWVWDMAKFEKVKKIKTERELMSVAVDSKRNRLVLGSANELWVRAYDFDSEKEIACNKGHHGPVRTLAFTPSGSFASGSVDGTIRIWQWPDNEATNESK